MANMGLGWPGPFSREKMKVCWQLWTCCSPELLGPIWNKASLGEGVCSKEEPCFFPRRNNRNIVKIHCQVDSKKNSRILTKPFILKAFSGIGDSIFYKWSAILFSKGWQWFIDFLDHMSHSGDLLLWVNILIYIFSRTTGSIFTKFCT